MRIKKAAVDCCASSASARVATAGPGGLPHVVPVCHVLVDGRVYFASGTEGRKVKNLEPTRRWQWSWTCTPRPGRPSRRDGAGPATLVARGPRFRKIRRLLYEKYVQYPAMPRSTSRTR